MPKACSSSPIPTHTLWRSAQLITRSAIFFTFYLIVVISIFIII
jgi:hypothetical protein